MNISCSNIKFSRARTGAELIMRGDISNRSGATINVLSLRLILYSNEDAVFKALVVVENKY